MEPVAARGFISGEVIRRHKDDVITLRDARIEAHSRQDSLDAQMDELRAEQRGLPYALLQERGDLLAQISKVRRDRALAAFQRGYLIQAAVSGTVTALQVYQGQTVDQRAAMMTVASASGAVTAELYVPSRAIGFVRPGQQVRVRYDAFPYQRFGSGTGRILYISLAVLRPEDVQAALVVKEPVYRVIVALDHPWIAAYGRRYPVQSGMAIAADIVLDEHSFGEWMLEPLRALRRS